MLFGEGGTALAAATSLRNHDITLVSCVDEPRLAALSRFVKKSVRLPDRSPASVTKFLETLENESRQPVLFMPISDVWIETLSNNLDQVLKVGRMLPDTPNDLALTLDKTAFDETIESLNLPRPIVFGTRIRPDWTPSVYPFVLKPSSTYRLEVSSGVKAMIVTNPQEWEDLDESVLAGNVFLAQEYLIGASISVCFCTTRHGSLAAAYATEKIHFGQMRTGSRVATVNRPDAIELAEQFVKLTGLVGYGELEMIDSARGLVLLELNARPWSQVLMSSEIDVPILELGLALLSGEDIAPCSTGHYTGLEWMMWDQDLLFRRHLRRTGQPIRPPMATRRLYSQSFLRDPVPAFIYALHQARYLLTKIF